jgi:putative SOS response-associated peptidase YedK
MCGRMTLAWSDLDEVADALEATYDEQLRGLYRPRYNIAPTDRHPVVILADDVEARGSGRRLTFAGWGFSRGPKRPPLFNARSETAALRDSFRHAFAARRCVVPADGFYEWSGPKDARQPHWIHRRDGRLLLMAGLYEDGPASDPAGPGVPAGRFSVLTTSPNQVVARLHDRMPVILEPGDVDGWLRDGAAALLKPTGEDTLTTQLVSARVNSVKNDDPGCLLPPQTEAPRQLRLI